MQNYGRKQFRNDCRSERQFDQFERSLPSGSVHEPLLRSQHNAQFQRKTANGRESFSAHTQGTGDHHNLHALNVAHAVKTEPLADVQTVSVLLRSVLRPGGRF